MANKSVFDNFRIIALITFFPLFIFFFIFFIWLFINQNYREYSLHDILFFLQTDTFDANISYYMKFVVYCIFLPILVSFFVLMFPYISKLLYITYKRKEDYIFYLLSLSLVFLSIVCYKLYQTAVNEKIIYREEGFFYESNFVKPDDKIIKFPDNKNNLIIISLESMEASFKDENFYGSSLISALEKLEKNEVVFSEYTDGYATTPTQPSLIAMFTGLPSTFVSIETLHNRKKIKRIFPKVYSLGKILLNNGYKTISLRGSDGNFSSTHQFLKEHGIEKNIGLKELLISQHEAKYMHPWGYSDEDVFEVAKDEIETLTRETTPFFLLIQTIDTHCDDKPNVNYENKFNNIYYNIINNTSEKTYAFIKWLEKLDVYKNTTIIVLGDHLRNSQKMVFPERRQIYNLFINSKTIPYSKNRIFTQIDLFPTILEAIGVKINGHKLGLGVSVFSNEKTLAEKYDKEHLKNELSKKSKLYDSLFRS